MGTWDRILIGTTAILAILAVATIVRTGPTLVHLNGPPQADRPVTDWERFLEGAPRLGREKAPISIVEFIDYACGACRSFQPTLEGILEQYPSDVSVVIRNSAQGSPESRLGARAAFCAHQQGFFPGFHRSLLKEASFDPEGSESSILRLASGVGEMDTHVFQACLASSDAQEALKTDSLLAVAIGITMTPSFIVNGQLYVNFHEHDPPVRRFFPRA